MEVFRFSRSGIEKVKQQNFAYEKELQVLFEENLITLADLIFIKSEFTIGNQRIDTLAYDSENRAFVIIEYKRSEHFSVIDQGVSYLNTLLRSKADFILEYNEHFSQPLKKQDVDWSQSKVIFVSPSFNETQKRAVDFDDLNIELWEVNKFDDMLTLNILEKSSHAPKLGKTVKNTQSNLATITKEIKHYTENDHLQDKSEDIMALYEQFKYAILNLSSSIKVIPKKKYISFKKDKQTISDIEIHKSQLKIYINAKYGEIEDDKHLAQDISKIGSWGNGDYRICVKDTKYLEYIMSLIKQKLY